MVECGNPLAGVKICKTKVDVMNLFVRGIRKSILFEDPFFGGDIQIFIRLRCVEC